MTQSTILQGRECPRQTSLLPAAATLGVIASASLAVHVIGKGWQNGRSLENLRSNTVKYLTHSLRSALRTPNMLEARPVLWFSHLVKCMQQRTFLMCSVIFKNEGIAEIPCLTEEYLLLRLS